MSGYATCSTLDKAVFDLQDTELIFFIYDTTLRRLMLSNIFSDPLMGLRFAATIFKAGKLDLCEIVGLIVVALNFSSGLRYVEHHHFSCAYYSRRRCVSMFGFGHDFLGMMDWS
jgi:hypothetical protein